MTSHVADVLIPLALDTAYSYAVPDGLALKEGVATPRAQPRIGVQDRVVVTKLVTQGYVHGLLRCVLEIARRNVGVHPSHYALPRSWS